MRKNSEELVGVFDYEKNAFGSGDDRTIIGVLDDGIQIKGRVQEGELEYGLTYRFSGYWYSHPKYGRQFMFSHYSMATPNGERGTVAYLARAAGIGAKRAQLIWNAYGSDAIEVVRTDPDRVCREIKGITPEIAANASAYFESNRAFEQTVIALTDLLANRNFPKSIIDRIIQKAGVKSVDIIKENPYWLLTFSGVGFPTADNLYLALGHDPSAMIRQVFCIWYHVHSDTRGNTWFNVRDCEQALEKSISGSAVNPAEALKTAVERGLLVTCQYDGSVYVAERSKAIQEDEVAYRFLMAMEKPRKGPDWESPHWDDLSRWPHPESMEISEHQVEQYRLATKNGRSRFAILAGRPGCGKTYVASEIIRAYGSKFGYNGILVCAPTGIAAKRLTKFLSDRSVPIRGVTIHRALGVGSVNDDGDFGFCHNAENPLPHRFIVVDEESMVSTYLLSSLLNAVQSGTMVLMIGDPNQLAPIGHGAPLRDCIAAGVPHGMLTDIRRNSGTIVRACSDILDTGTFTCGSKFKLPEENLVCISNGNPEDQKAAIVRILSSVRTFGDGYDPKWDVQVMTPVNENTPVCRKDLNRMLKDVLNPDGKPVSGSPFSEGDKIVCTKNGKVPACLRNEWGVPSDQWSAFMADEVDEEDKVAVANGEFGLVLRAEPKLTYVKMFDPLRFIKIPRGSGKDAEDTGCKWELAYAVTFHKGQGNQWPFVVMVMDEHGSAKFVASRELVYTGISRGQIGTIIVGNLKTAQSFCRKTGIWNRKTFLKEKLMEEMPIHNYGSVVD